MSRAVIRAFALSLMLTTSAVSAGELPAFPGAEGSGATTPGGRGGEVYLVTTLDDSGPGSLREGCEAEGPRMVVVNVDGIIELASPIQIQHPFITIAGQAAPGDGVCLKNHGLHIMAEDVVVRYLRVRDAPEDSGIVIDEGRRVVIDHCSVSWSKGPALVLSHAADVTLQWNLFAETLCSRNAAEEKPGIGISIRAEGGTFSIHHNYFAHHNTGNPYIAGAREKPGPLLDVRQNVVYDWGERPGDSGGSIVRYNFVCNTYKPGPSTLEQERAVIFHLGSLESQAYYEDNELVGSTYGTANNFFTFRKPKGFRHQGNQDLFRYDSAFEAPPVSANSRSAVLKRVLDEAGASKPRRDSVDERLIAQYGLGVGRLVSFQAETGVWPTYLAQPVPADGDEDGMADDWERNFGLSPDNPADHALDLDGDGYTNIEEYLNSAQPGPLVER